MSAHAHRRDVVLRFATMSRRSLLAIYVVADVVCVGLGMSVPIFCILLGLIVGRVLALRAPASEERSRSARRLLAGASLTSAVTLAMMAAIWGSFGAVYFDPTVDLANTGVPMILYTPQASFVGWIVLMIVVSPLLQILTTVFAGTVVFARLRGAS